MANQQPADTAVNKQALRRLIDAHFNDPEINTLCFDLDVDYESLPGQGKSARIAELILAFNRMGRLPELMEYCRRERPKAPWDQLSETMGAGSVHAQSGRPPTGEGDAAVIKVLFLAANPTDTGPLRLDEEVREIDQALRMTEFRDVFDIRQHWAVRATDLQELLLREQPDIVHFSGHGGQTSEIILEGNDGTMRAVPAAALSGLFDVLQGNIRCVVLNACYSEKQARAIGQHIDFVIGMTKAVGDKSAIRFAAAFYQALGYGKDVQTAFKLGCLQIHLEDLQEQDTPQLIADRVNPAAVFLVPQ